MRSFIESLHGNDIPLQFVLLNWVIDLQALAYMGAVLVLLGHYTNGLTKVLSSIENVRLRWLKNITLLAIVALLFFLFENIAFLFNVRFESSSPFSSFIAPVFIYTIGYLGLLTSEIFTEPETERSIREAARFLIEEEKLEAEQAETRLPEQETNGKYLRSGLSIKRAGQLAAELEELMETGRPYTDPSLTLNRLAVMLDISSHNLSEVINTRFKQNFFDFVNSYRVKQVKRELSDEKNKVFTVLALAFDAGFNSKSSFNRKNSSRLCLGVWRKV